MESLSRVRQMQAWTKNVTVGFSLHDRTAGQRHYLYEAVNHGMKACEYRENVISKERK